MFSVRDIMRSDVVTTRVDDSARSLARLLSDSEISGAPVLDSNGKVVGVASSTDLVRLAADESDVNFTTVSLRIDDELDDEISNDSHEADPYGFFLPEDSPMQGMEILEQFPETSFDTVEVGDIMTPVSFAVHPDMPVPELCQFLVRGRIHRALVVDEGELLGIVTSHDVLRAVADEVVAA
jgi:CBS domain-containing protein